MLLRCNATWIAEDTGSRYESGNTYDVAARRGEVLYLDAPEGTFDVIGAEPPRRPLPAPVPEAITAPTASGLTVPDRRARGGRVRGVDDTRQDISKDVTTIRPSGDCPWKRCDYVTTAIDRDRAVTAHLGRAHGGKRPGA